MIEITGFCQIEPVIDIRRVEHSHHLPPITDRFEAVKYMSEDLIRCPSEQAVALFIDHDLRPIAYCIIGRGNSSCCLIDIRAIISGAVLLNAFNVILMHTHPPGGQVDFGPSDQDVKISKLLRFLLRHIGVSLVDDLVVSHDPASGSLVGTSIMSQILEEEERREEAEEVQEETGAAVAQTS